MYLNHFEEADIHEPMADQFAGIDLNPDSDSDLDREYGAELGPDFSSVTESRVKKKKGVRQDSCGLPTEPAAHHAPTMSSTSPVTHSMMGDTPPVNHNFGTLTKVNKKKEA